MSELEKMINGEMYNAGCSELVELRRKSRLSVKNINNELNAIKRSYLLKDLFKSTGEYLNIEPDLRVDYGFNITVGENFFSNFGTIILDVCPVVIGDNCMFGPNVQLYTATHPLDPIERNSGLEFGIPITIGDNAWLGGGVIVCPGVTLGDNVVVGAGSVVTKSFGDNVVLVGNPARVVKELVSPEQSLVSFP